MKEQIQNLVRRAVEALPEEVLSPEDRPSAVQVERTRDRAHGDLATNVAMTLAKPAKRNPRQLAELVIEQLPESGMVDRVEIAGPGFINFFLAPAAYHAVVRDILDRGDDWGRSEQGRGHSVLLEFVSANPTGPLHVGHGRGAAYGASVGNLLDALGYRVHREYYVNDAGRQMDILAASVWLRYLELVGETIPFPSNGYRGDYIVDIARKLHESDGERWRHPADAVRSGLPADAPEGDKEKHIDGLVTRARELLGDDGFVTVFEVALAAILADIREDLAGFGVTFDEWFSERSLTRGRLVDHALEKLTESGDVYEKEGARWFRATNYGDEKDRVVVRANGDTTYFASDIAYHLNKRERGFDTLIDVLGADHHGYIARLKAGMAGMGEPPESLEIRLVQFANLWRGTERLQMSTRSGEFVTLRELREEVGKDAARFFYVLRSNEQHLDFDLELAKSQSNDNPVYYIQYAHARICSVFGQLEEKGLNHDPDNGRRHLDRLVEDHEDALLVSLAKYPEILELSGQNRAPHHMAHYLRDLANDFHTYYNAHTFLVDDPALRDARLVLITSVRQVIRNGLALLGVSAPEKM